MSEVQRINFIEREPISFTYRRLILAVGTVFALAALAFGLLVARGAFLERKATRLAGEVAKLKADQERLLKKLEAETAGLPQEAGRSDVGRLLDAAVSWSTLMKELTSEFPPSLWLSSLKSYEKADLPSKHGILINGYAEEAASVTQFVKSLSHSPYFDHVILTSLKQETGSTGERYQFAIDLAVSPPKGGPKGV